VISHLVAAEEYVPLRRDVGCHCHDGEATGLRAQDRTSDVVDQSLGDEGALSWMR
jgi:hypothetical protein